MYAQNSSTVIQELSRERERERGGGGGGGCGRGAPLSPVLFILFVNDLLESTSIDDTAVVTISDIKLFMLLYCDDAVLFAKSPECLQNMLNKLYDYSFIWDIKVNTDKTKIMIFEKGRKSNVAIYYHGILLKTVENFKFLDVMFYRNGSWNRTQNVYLIMDPLHCII